MTSEKKLIKSFPLAHTKKGKISVTHLSEPYGENSESVVSIGISLKGDDENPDWKAHIPYANLDELISSLQEAKKKYGA